ncbi:MAG: LL-diaminopimelate aminotransferase [Lachnoclostridium sp.]|nr:LL-diaminopimelate aminotransferase [Lachnoclostridium sp.]
MIKVNSDFCKLPGAYLFSEVARIVGEYQSVHPDTEIIRMGIGDVTRPLCRAAVDAIKAAADEQASAATFHGYGPEQGYTFLRELIAEHDYRVNGVDISSDEIFISDGAKSDLGNIGDILSDDCRVAVPDPVYPVYVDTNVMNHRAGDLTASGRWNRLVYLEANEANDFNPALPAEPVDIIYLCYPNNPTGTTLTRDRLKEWVDYCIEHDTLLLFDSAYEAYVTSPDVPRSIYEITGARRVAIEFRSYSKTAGFTGMRLGYTVVPRELSGSDDAGNRVSLHKLWLRRQTTKFNGASYVSQRAAAALYSTEGAAQVRESIEYYLGNARIIRSALATAGYKVWGGIDSPYIWVKAPEGMTSWDFFHYLLERHHIVATPGSGFGPSGEGYLRLTAFNTRELTLKAMNRMASSIDNQ